MVAGLFHIAGVFDEPAVRRDVRLVSDDRIDVFLLALFSALDPRQLS